MGSSPMTPCSPESISPSVDEVTSFRTKISKALRSTTIKTFAVGDKIAPPSPCLSIDDKPVILPLSRSTLFEIASSSAPAMVETGEHTVIDPNIRHCRQIDATRIGVSSSWEAYTENLASSVAKSLGVYDDVTAKLCKLVLYEGELVLSHRDAEKEDGMFATLNVQLPCKHDEGGLIIRHRGEEKRFVYSEGSDREYFYTAFYAVCEHKILPVRGSRLVLVYNLVRQGGGSDFMCISDVAQMLKEAGKEWEKVKGKPNKLAIKLHHDYTYANLSFKELKGRDSIIVEALKQSGMYNIYIALVDKKKHGIGDEEDILFAVYGPEAGQEEGQEGGQEEGEEEQQENGNENDDESVSDMPPYEDVEHLEASANFEMFDCIEESVKTLKWIGEDEERDTGATLKQLSVDVKNEVIGDEDLFAGKPDEEEAEINGDEATVDYFYHRAFLVFWPESRHFANMCAGDFHLAVTVFTACSSMCMDVYIDTVIQHAEDYLEEAREYLIPILLTVCELKRTEAILRVLNLFGKPQIIESNNYYDDDESDGESDGSGAGISTSEHANAIVEAINVCGYELVSEQVVAAVAVTNTASLYRCAELALRLSKLNGFDAAAAFMARTVADQALSRDFDDEESKVGPIAEMMFTVPAVSNLRDIYVTKVKTLHPKIQFQVIVTLHQHCSTPKSFPHLFGPLVKEYTRRALHDTFELSLHAHQLGDAFEILLGPKPRDEAILESFVQEFSAYRRSGPFLKRILQRRNVGSNVDDAFVRRLADVRFSQLLLEKPPFTFRQPEAKMKGYPLVEEFLRGEEQKMVYADFEDIWHARAFASQFGDNPIHLILSCGYSAKAQLLGEGKEAKVLITKTDVIYKYQLETYKQDCEEYKRIRPLLTRSSGMKTSEVKRRRLNQGKSC